MIVLAPLAAVLVLVVIAWLGVSLGLDVLFGVLIPHILTGRRKRLPVRICGINKHHGFDTTTR